MRAPDSGRDSPLAAAAVILAVILLVVYFMFIAPAGPGTGLGEKMRKSAGAPSKGEGFDQGMKHRDEYFHQDLAEGYPYNFSVGAEDEDLARHRFYSSAEVDPIVTGQLFAGPRAGGPGRRLIYGGRTSHSDRPGMAEFGRGVPGEPGVDVGLLGMREYSLTGGPDVFDDGIPENWRMPSTPVTWYAPAQRDYYDVEGKVPRPYEKNLMSLREPDHEPHIGATSW